MTHHEIIEFIRTIRESFDGAEVIYKFGSCYHFYLILKTVNPDAKAYSDDNHVITRIFGRFYDITGEVERGNHIPVDYHYSHEKLKKLKFKLADLIDPRLKDSYEKLKT
jgi:hypothetical protein